ncbi:MAG: response regulator [Myxococcota bacterium]
MPNTRHGVTSVSQQVEEDLDPGGSIEGHPSGTVLIVDDNAVVRHSLGYRLGLSGYQIQLAAGVNDAFALLGQASRFSALIVDVFLTDGSGADIVRRWREQYPHSPVIIMSGFSGIEDSLRELLNERTRFMQKPLQPHHLLQQLNQMRDDFESALAGRASGGTNPSQ